MPGTSLPATASAVCASSPKICEIHADENPSSAARRTSSARLLSASVSPRSTNRAPIRTTTSCLIPLDLCTSALPPLASAPANWVSGRPVSRFHEKVEHGRGSGQQAQRPRRPESGVPERSLPWLPWPRVRVGLIEMSVSRGHPVVDLLDADAQVEMLRPQYRRHLRRESLQRRMPAVEGIRDVLRGLRVHAERLVDADAAAVAVEPLRRSRVDACRGGQFPAGGAV